jgi:hypothetical protein|tara:strand:- start:315 stop:575 length:261 start_codon:yes stop_codon:yes gene_type:complete
MKIDNINLDTWYKNRFLKDQIPNHFTITRTKQSAENFNWVLEKLHGRFALVQNNSNNNEMDFMSYYQKTYAFEDPKEAVQFELTWS